MLPTKYWNARVSCSLLSSKAFCVIMCMQRNHNPKKGPRAPTAPNPTRIKNMMVLASVCPMPQSHFVSGTHQHPSTPKNARTHNYGASWDRSCLFLAELFHFLRDLGFCRLPVELLSQNSRRFLLERGLVGFLARPVIVCDKCVAEVHPGLLNFDVVGIFEQLVFFLVVFEVLLFVVE